MLVQILYNLEDRPATSGAEMFKDVPDSAWCFDAVNWAASVGIVGGYGNGMYRPDDSITREQLAAMLYRYAQYKEYDVSVGEGTNLLSYTDASRISEYAIPAMHWACGTGIIAGVTSSTLVPKGTAIINGRIIKIKRLETEEKFSARGKHMGSEVRETISNKMVFNVLTPKGFKALT